MTYQTTLEFATAGRGTRDITADVAGAVAASGLRCGVVHVFVQHTSCSLTITENADPDVRRDLETVMARLAPDGDPAWRHDAEGPDDMAAHVRSMLTSTSVSVPVGAAACCSAPGRASTCGNTGPRRTGAACSSPFSAPEPRALVQHLPLKLRIVKQ